MFKVLRSMFERVVASRWRIDANSSFVPVSRDEWMYIQGGRRFVLNVERQVGDYGFAIYAESLRPYDADDRENTLSNGERDAVLAKVQTFLSQRSGKKVQIISTQ